MRKLQQAINHTKLRIKKKKTKKHFAMHLYRLELVWRNREKKKKLITVALTAALMLKDGRNLQNP